VDPDKVKAIVEMERPDDISGIRRFLGMVNQLNKFSPKITELTKPLKKKVVQKKLEDIKVVRRSHKSKDKFYTTQSSKYKQ
jgi:hypothetical protein